MKRHLILSWLGLVLLALALASALLLGRHPIVPILAALLVACGLLLIRAQRR